MMTRYIRSSVACSPVLRDRADDTAQFVVGKMRLTVANVIVRSHK